jgi:hypothetical protein
LNEGYGRSVPVFETFSKDASEKERLRIRWGADLFLSPSYEQEGDPATEGTGPFDDVAIVLKMRNPWNPDKQLLIVAGVRGIGTWGAGEFLKKGYMQLYTKLHVSRFSSALSSAQFAAIVSVCYQEFDITETHVILAKTIPLR